MNDRDRRRSSLQVAVELDLTTKDITEQNKAWTRSYKMYSPQGQVGAVGVGGGAEDGGPLGRRGVHAALHLVRGARVYQGLWGARIECNS